MEIHNYIYFISMAFAYIVSPGPAVFISINYGAIYGLKQTIYLLFGNTIGLGILAFISAIGVGSLITNSVFLNNAFKIMGALILIYIAIKMILNSKNINFIKNNNVVTKQKNIIDFFKEGLWLSLSNPKPIIFFISIYPQFINFNENTNIQFLILGLTFMLISFLSLSVYAISSKYTFGKILTKTNAKLFNYFSGFVLIIISIFLIFSTINFN